MKTGLYVIGLLAMAAAMVLLLGACKAGVSEERVATLEGNLEAARGDVQAVKGDVGALKGALSVAPAERLFEVTAIELKGATSTSKLAPPEKNPKDISDAFGFDPPGVFDKADPTRWQVSAYVWTPGAMMAYAGDKLKLEIFVVNGDEHATHIEDPDGKEIVKEQKQNRGRLYTIDFTAAKPGLYKLICTNHDPTMTANILVLPRP